MRFLAWLMMVVALYTPASAAPDSPGSAGSAPLPERGRLVVTLEQAVRYDGVEAAGASGRFDLEVILPIRAGRLRGTGLAWLSATPAVYHPVRIANAEAANDEIALDLVVTFKPVVPHLTGGQGTFGVELTRDGAKWTGDYEGRTEGLSSADAKALWVELGGVSTAVDWRGGLADATTRSVRHVPAEEADRAIVARGRIEAHDPPTEKDAGAPLAETIRLALATERGAAWLAPLENAQPEPERSAGERALLDALRALAADTSDPATSEDASNGRTAQSAEAARVALSDRAGRSVHDRARDLAATALAYRLVGDIWPEADRTAVREALRDEAHRLTGVRAVERLADSPFAEVDAAGEGARLGRIEGPWDYRLAVARAAAGIAMLSIIDRDAPQPADERALMICRLTIERFLAEVLGPEGAWIAHPGNDEAMAIIYPFLALDDRQHNTDRLGRTGAPNTAAWAMTTWGHGVAHPESTPIGDWFAPAALAAGEAHRPAVRHYLETHDFTPRSPLAATSMLLAWPTLRSVEPAPSDQRVYLDRAVGAMALRRGDDPARDILTLFHAGSGPAPAAATRGQFSITAFGRQWIHREARPFGVLTPPDPRRQNTLQVHEGLISTQPAALPASPGSIARVRAERNGSGSVSMVGPGFVNVDENDNPLGPIEDAKYLKNWRTLGVDTTGGSGAAGLWVLVDGSLGLGQRQRIGTLHLGDLPENAVTIEGERFTIAPPGTGATMRGRVLYPPTAWLEYEPPNEHRGGRLRIHAVKPGPSTKQMLEHEMRQSAQAVQRMDDTEWRVEEDPIWVDFFPPGEKEPEAEQVERERIGNVLLNKHLQVVTSTSMGGPDRYPSARDAMILVLTLQPDDTPHPTIEVLPAGDPDWLRIGPQRVRYHEHLIEFREGVEP